jgi:hypothetical protein
VALSSETQRGTVFKSVFSTGSEAAAAPTLATQGQPLLEMAGLYVAIEADSTRTLSGAGSLTAYIYDSAPGAFAAWVRCPDLDLPVPASASGLRRVAFSGLQLVAPRGTRLMYIPVGVTLSAGGLTVYQMGFTRNGRY